MHGMETCLMMYTMKDNMQPLHDLPQYIICTAEVRLALSVLSSRHLKLYIQARACS